MRKNYSREERQKIVEEYIQSGKSQTLFALEHENKA
jgi:transposase-like protein